MKTDNVPDKIVLENLNYYERRTLAQNWYGPDDKFDPRIVFGTLCIHDEWYRNMKPDYDKHIHALTLSDYVRDNFYRSCMIGSGWAVGDSRQFDEWLQSFEAPIDFIKMFLDIDDNYDNYDSCDPGGGSYGMYLYVYGWVVVAQDTEGHAWYFPAETDLPPEVGDYCEIDGESNNLEVK